MSGLRQFTNELTTDERETLSLRRFVLTVMEEFGGPEDFARAVYQDYEQAPIGSNVRGKLSDTVIRLLERYGTDADDDDEMEAEDFEVQLRRLILEEAKENATFRRAVIETVLQSAELRPLIEQETRQIASQVGSNQTPTPTPSP